jgi:hypothetical protein
VDGVLAGVHALVPGGWLGVGIVKGKRAGHH